ncbi:MAG: RNA polymerase sigma factor [Pseudomonadota bacterium]
METTDEALATAAGRGDRAAFASLVDRHYERLFRMCWHLTRAEDQAEDLAQDICLKLPRALRGFRAEAKFTTWLYRVVLNSARDAGRRDTTRTRAMEAYGREATLAGSDAGQESRASWLDHAMGALKPDLAETAALIVGQELSQADAAAVLGISPGTVAWRMSEVKKALAAMARADIEADKI